jgi:hypothetical protein
MSTSKPKNPNESEEIDLGVLFNAIGNGISRLFTAIGNSIMFVLNTILQLAVFVRKRIVYFALASILGLAAGVFLERKIPLKYVATATVEPNFDSARQSYGNINYLNDLATQKDSVQLASFFGISLSEAASLIKLEITPFVTKTSLLQEYNDYTMGLDSLVATEMSYKQYVKQINDFERKTHMLKAESTEQGVFSKLLSPLITSVSEPAYFKEQQATQLANLELMDSITQVSIVQADSLLSLFEEVRIVEANKAFSNGTNLYMSEATEDNAEIALLNRKITLSEQIEKIRLDKLKARNVVDIVAAFPKVGYLEKSSWKNKKTQGIAAGLFLLSLFYLTIHLDAFLKSKS